MDLEQSQSDKIAVLSRSALCVFREVPKFVGTTELDGFPSSTLSLDDIRLETIIFQSSFSNHPFLLSTENPFFPFLLDG